MNLRRDLSLFPQVSGVLENNDYLDKWKDHPNVMYARPLVQPGHKCVCVEDGLPTWVAELMVSKGTAQESIDFINQIVASLEIPITPSHHVS